MKKQILTAALFILGQLLYAQSFQNLGFEESCENTKTGACFWELSWGTQQVHIATQKENGNNALIIRSTQDQGVGFVEQVVQPPKSESLRLFSATARVKSKYIVGRGGGLNLSILDKEGNYLFINDMGYGSLNWVSGDNDWHTISIKGIIAPETTLWVI